MQKIWLEMKLYVSLQRKRKYKQTKLKEDNTMTRTNNTSKGYSARPYISKVQARYCELDGIRLDGYASESYARKRGEELARNIDERRAAEALALHRREQQSLRYIEANGLEIRHHHTFMLAPLVVLNSDRNGIYVRAEGSLHHKGYRYSRYRYTLHVKRGWRCLYVGGMITFVPAQGSPRKGCKAEWISSYSHQRGHVVSSGYLYRGYHSEQRHLYLAIAEAQEARRNRAAAIHRRRAEKGLWKLPVNYYIRSKGLADSVVSLERSIAAGNCPAGSRAFCEATGLDPEGIYTWREVLAAAEGRPEYDFYLKRIAATY